MYADVCVCWYQMLRGELQRAEGELEDRCWSPPVGLQQWLQLTHEIENKAYIKKKNAAEKQLQQAREAVSLFLFWKYYICSAMKGIGWISIYLCTFISPSLGIWFMWILWQFLDMSSSSSALQLFVSFGLLSYSSPWFPFLCLLFPIIYSHLPQIVSHVIIPS